MPMKKVTINDIFQNISALDEILKEMTHNVSDIVIVNSWVDEIEQLFQRIKPSSKILPAYQGVREDYQKLLYRLHYLGMDRDSYSAYRFRRG